MDCAASFGGGGRLPDGWTIAGSRRTDGWTDGDGPERLA